MTETSELPPQPHYCVTIWEGMAIAAGAVFIVAIGLAGLGYRFLSNTADPQRAMLIARSLMDYRIPGGAQGVLGANLGGAKVAIVSSPSFPKDPASLSPADVANVRGVELFIARVPLDVETTSDPATAHPYSEQSPDPYDIFASPDFSLSHRSGEDFKVTSEQIQERRFCNRMVPIRIQAGELLLSSQLPSVAAVKYDAIATLEDGKRQITLTAIGQDASKQAATVFNSLRCKT
ncbi:MAG: hypothetical protein HC866_17245 [Leptolyngbyaceae cyanobacterium RU_5_1]|nr:hypothetical protein [Leptolyngbyaceae cyanobacterium RU_5_1]